MSDANDRDEYLMARVARGQPEFLEKLNRRHASPRLTSCITFLTTHKREASWLTTPSRCSRNPHTGSGP
jgi:hypothetical protein